MQLFKPGMAAATILFMLAACKQLEANTNAASEKQMYKTAPARNTDMITEKLVTPSLDTALFDSLQKHLLLGRTSTVWPVKTEYPSMGAILPYKRIVAYYGNFYSKNMGILGALPEDQMVQKLQDEVKRWQEADSIIPVQPAIHYIAVTAQHDPGKGAKYRIRMPSSQIEHAITLADKINAIAFLDVQVGHSSLQEELPMLEPFLKRPEVHLGIDPEFSMKGGQVPSSVIGTFDASDVNYASQFLDSLVKKYNLPPKVLIVHRFTKGMLTNYKNVKLRKDVQIVVDMDGWGIPAKKKTSYNTAVTTEPIQFAGFKLFYKNDLSNGSRMMEPKEVLSLYPSPIYIQYQ